MRIDRAYLPVTTLGPGKRIVVWTQGCRKRCAGCANPELWDAQGGRDIPEDELSEMLFRMAGHSGIDRITFTGGDPLEQLESLLRLLRKIRMRFRDILVYTGYELGDVEEMLGQDGFSELKGLADAIIDGPYVESQNDGKCALRGSTNQQLHLFDEGLQADYDEAMRRPREVQNVVFDGRSMSIGIHAS